MRTCIASSVATLVVFALPLAAQERADVKPKGEAKSAEPPRAVYQHTTPSGRVGKFELNGDSGKADYYFNGQHYQDDLVYVRSAEMRGGPSIPSAMPGWIYQVSRKDKKEPLWFFFAAEPLAQGGPYAMFYSTTPPNPDGKQPWTRILTPGGTKQMSLDKKAKESEEGDKQ